MGAGIEGGDAKIAGFEPVTLFAALAPLTQHIGFIASATYEEPCNTARKFASLDLISGGRAGWNVVTTATESAAHNFNLDQQHPDAFRYKRAAEHVDVVKKLWDSFEDDAFLRDKESGQFFDAAKVHPIDHTGEAEAREKHDRLTSLILEEDGIALVKGLAGGTLDVAGLDLDGPLPPVKGQFRPDGCSAVRACHARQRTGRGERERGPARPVRPAPGRS